LGAPLPSFFSAAFGRGLHVGGARSERRPGQGGPCHLAGQRLPDCHGAFADGERQRDEMPAGANLRSTRLDAAALKEAISCGRPGTGMPLFNQSAWQADACNRQTPASPPDDLFPAPATLTPDEIDAVVAYLQARVIGKGRTVTKQECLFYYADEPDWCEDYK
jgi:hypothetical protein